MRDIYFEKYKNAYSGGMHFLVPKEFEGRSREERLALVRERMEKAGIKELPLENPEDVCWLLNLRGWDRMWELAAECKAVLGSDVFELYIDSDKLSDDVSAELSADGIRILRLSEWQGSDKPAATQSEGISAGEKAPEETGEKAGKELYELIPKHLKSEKEAENMRLAHKKEGLAAVRLMKWLKELSGAKLTGTGEIDVVDKLERIRSEMPGYICPSFDTIAACDRHATGIKIEDFHYDPSVESSEKLREGALLLVDFGAQYPGGTTDCTRTFALGEISEERKKNYTIALKAVLALSGAKFSKGVTGVGLDMLARRPVYEAGMDFGHGTGHGVGYMLNVHESPSAIRPRIAEEKADTLPLEEGMVFSVEPGVYIKDSYGIRLENLVLVQRDEELCKAKADGFHEEFLRLETLTLVPFDRDAIAPALLTSEEKKALNDYHKRVYESLEDELTEAEKAWLSEVTAPIVKENYKFHQHRDCEFFPCHETSDPEHFNCLFCYCPLYALGDSCGGNFKILENGNKDCSACMVPHGRNGYGYIIGKYPEIIAVAKSNTKGTV